MIIDLLHSSLLLAESDGGFLVSTLSQVWLWTRVALGIGLVIFVHELGHFLAAKTFGVKCEKFYVGFDVPIQIGPIKFPRTLGKFTYGETEYGIGILPLGGYVKMLGQDDDPRKAKEEAERIRRENGGDEDAPVELDPRSYPAKTVWQRMIIISAGVIMNLITGILFAAIAYGYGVSYTPAVIGAVTPGGPAWQAGIEPGGRVIAIGDYEDEEMPFREMKNAILKAGLEDPKKPIDVSIRYDDGVRNYKLLTAPHPMDSDLRMIGIGMPREPQMGVISDEDPNDSPDKPILVSEDSGAKVIGFDGEQIAVDSIVSGTPLFNHLYSNPTKPVKLELERADGSNQSVVIPPRLEKTLGLRFAVGPITAVTENGPAREAGVKVGDVITGINGETEFDALGLPVTLATVSDPLKLSLKRVNGDGENGASSEGESVEVELARCDSPQTIGPMSGLAGEVASNAYGFAYQPLNRLLDFSGEMASDDDQEFLAGDRFKEARIVIDELVEKADVDSLTLEELKDFKFDNPSSITQFSYLIQSLPLGTKFRLIGERGPKNKIISATLVLHEGDRFRFERDLPFVGTQSIQTADSFGHALTLGWTEGKRRLRDVFQFLGMLVRGKIKAKLIGGPIRIAQMAGQQAESGISKLLLFLTLLSMNLAILNFLPIPALDGGHMMFLIAEAIRGKRVDEELEMKLTLAGVFALLALMAFVFINDIINIQ